MKGLTCTLCIMLLSIAGFSQTTYYWIGGTGPASFTSNNNWNTQLDGLGTSRSVAGDLTTDILIFDGTNVGGITPTTGNVTVTTSSDTIARLLFQNNVTVQITRTSAGSANINLQGEGTALDDLVIEAGSTVTLGEETYNYDVRFLLGLPTVPTTATGSISGNIYLSPLSNTVHTASYITSRTTNGLVFETGANCYVTDSTTASPFNGSVTNSVLFKTGSSLHYYTGRSPFGNALAVQFANFDAGSNFYVHKTNRSYLDGVTVYASSSWVNSKSFANVFIMDGANLIADGPVFRIDNLTINTGCTFTTHTSGHTPVLGNLTVDGLFDFPSGSNVLLMGGHVPQTISGSGTINTPNFVVADFSDVTLSKVINVTSSTNIVGNINFGTSGQIAGAGTFTSRVASSAASGPGNTTAGSYQVTFTAPSGINGYSITGAGLAPNTNVIGFGASANLIYLSKPAVSTVVGSTFSFSSDTATLQTANSNGFNPVTGSVVNAGTQSFQSGTNYIVDAATTQPFGISTSAGANITVGNVILNAAVTTNIYCRIAGTLTMNSGNLSIRPADTVRILSGAAIVGAPFSSSKYVISQRSGNNLGVLRIDDLPVTTTLFPVGTSNYYLPVSVTPESTVDHAVSVFEGVTEDGTPTGTAFSAAKKAQVVDAVWIVDRPAGTGNCIMELQWDAALEGSSFVSYPGASLGISRHDGTAWGISLGTGDNALNTSTALYSNFSPFGVGYNGALLASQVKNISAYIKSNTVEIHWYVSNEAGIGSYEIEKSVNRNDFNKTGTVNVAGKDKYVFTDLTAVSGVIYYRIKIIGLSGEIKYTEIVFVKMTGKNDISLYPNPAVNNMTISGLTNASSYKIINAAGQVVLQQKTTASSFSIDVSNLKAGLYIIEIVSTDNKSVKESFIKQ